MYICTKIAVWVEEGTTKLLPVNLQNIVHFSKFFRQQIYQ